MPDRPISGDYPRPRARPLGVSRTPGDSLAANVAVWAPGLEAVDLIWSEPGLPWQRHTLGYLEGGVHFDLIHVSAERAAAAADSDLDPYTFMALPPGTRYGFIPSSSAMLREGNRTPETEQILLDPHGHGLERVSRPDALSAHDPRMDAYGTRYVSSVVDERFDWGGDVHPDIPWRDTVIYEAHVKGLTIQHPDIPEELRGTYAGLAHPVMIGYLRDLGVTTVELLPIHAHLDEPHLTENGLSNYWGYNTLSYFAPHAAYATVEARARGTQGVLEEIKTMVKALHTAGLEVVLDVVYNHTAEGGPTEPAYCWRGLGDADWYRHHDGHYLDVTGCGNTLDFANTNVVRMALDSLRYWVRQLHVDGFRFDLAPALARGARHIFSPRHPFLVAAVADPVIGASKLIAEPWDVGMGGWQTGNFPPGWADWNDAYRDTVRDFWLTDQRIKASGGTGGGLSRLADALAGSVDRFAASGRTPLAAVNFVTAHDGFTLYDLTAYDQKHNEANREGNRDGTNDNHSWNHGEEGPARTASVRAARARTARNIMATLLLSQGVPMITAGDEFLRTQHGNNNAYCQDSPIGWVNWKKTPADRAMLACTKELLQLRRRFLRSQPDDYMKRVNDVRMEWFSPSGEHMQPHEWQTSGFRTVQMVVGARASTTTGLVLVNGDSSDVEVTLPGLDALQGLITQGEDTHPEESPSGFELLFSTEAALRTSYGTQYRAGASTVAPALSMTVLRVI
ncbi:glycogen debranching protein GlgX [Kocuria coralli]|uniref:Glycogen debranching protein GlgX n=2 Tax=Kocuria coralli TaxID=1461025 RepID=A0A5J5KUX7_9MICC|nr:glycogen debranching protein GlgX [Kocuria coralli]